jgi:hypothetical protein
LNKAGENESVKKILNPLLRRKNSFLKFCFKKFLILAFGSAVLDECLLKAGFNNESCTLGKTFHIEQGIDF